jgi:hypothetical protein
VRRLQTWKHLVGGDLDLWTGTGSEGFNLCSILSHTYLAQFWLQLIVILLFGQVLVEKRHHCLLWMSLECKFLYRHFTSLSQYPSGSSRKRSSFSYLKIYSVVDAEAAH